MRYNTDDILGDIIFLGLATFLWWVWPSQPISWSSFFIGYSLGQVVRVVLRRRNEPPR